MEDLEDEVEEPRTLTALETAPILETGYAVRGDACRLSDKDPLPPRVPSSNRLVKMCCHYGIKNHQDMIHMEEFTLGDGGRVDMLTVDLKTHFIRGFEIKVSRADFKRDKKWHLYLKYFNFFYFVTPPGVIRKDELPPEVYHLEWALVEPPRAGQYSSYAGQPVGFPFDELVVRKRGQRLQPRFTRETYTEHFFHNLLLQYIRNLKWRSDRWSKLCRRCLAPMED